MGRKISDKTLSLAAAILGKKGGSMNTEKQHTAHVEAARKLNSGDVSARNRKAAQTIPEDDRKTRARNAVAARWAKYKIGMSNEEFREIAAAFTARELAEGLGVSYGKVLTWRRKANPIPIGVEDAKRIREWIKAHTDPHADR